MTAPPENRQLLAFVTLADELNFTRAATLLHLTQQSLSKQIAALERALGTALFERTTREVRLTPAGLAMLPRAHEVLRAVSAAVEAAAGATAPSGLAVDISSGGIATGAVLVNEMRASHPDVALHQIEVGVARGTHQIRQGRVQLVLGLAPEDLTGLAHEVVRHERVLVGMHESHPLAHQDQVSLTDLAMHPLLLPSDDVAGEWNSFVARLVARSGGRGPRRWRDTTHGSASAAEALRSGSCVTPTLSWWDPPADLAFRALADSSAVFTWSLLWGEGDESSATRRFVEAARAVRDREGWLTGRP